MDTINDEIISAINDDFKYAGKIKMEHIHDQEDMWTLYPLNKKNIRGGCELSRCCYNN